MSAATTTAQSSRSKPTDLTQTDWTEMPYAYAASPQLPYAYAASPYAYAASP